MAAQMFRSSVPPPTINRQFYDSGISYPVLYPLPVDTNIISGFHVPSSRYFYPSLDGQFAIPYIALPIPGVTMDPNQLLKDVAAWKADPPGQTIYAIESVQSVDPQIDLIQIIEGKKIQVPADNLNRYLREFGRFLDDMRNYPEQERFALAAGRRIIELMLNYPFNRAANFIKASQLAHAPTVQSIQSYLDRIGIIHFRADDIIGLSPGDIFFYLTRFYGPPIDGDLNSQLLERTYLRQANNESTRQLAREIARNFEKFNKFRHEFDLVFSELNRNPNSTEIERVFDTNSRQRFMLQPFSYLELLRNAGNLPLLTLNTIRQLGTTDREQIITLLRRYSDRSIIQLVGTSIQDVPSRSQLLLDAANILISTRVFLLTPFEADLCNNQESITTLNEFRQLDTAYLGRGSFTTGFDCYEIEDLINAFESHRDQNGVYTFVDPLNLSNQFRVRDLMNFREALESGRAGIASNPQLLARFDNYIEIAHLQSQSDFQQIQRLRQWVNESPQNKDIMRNLLLNYFYMGMYMRQWNGPGHPYPITQSQTGRQANATSQLGIQIAENVHRAKLIVEQYISQLPADISEIFWNLRVYLRQNNQIIEKERSIRYRWDEVMNGSYCIRMASAPWGFTGAYYLKQIVNEEIPGFDLGQNIDFVY